MGFNPCIDHCYIRYGKQYDPNNDTCRNCDYAISVKEKNAAIHEIKVMLEDPSSYNCKHCKRYIHNPGGDCDTANCHDAEWLGIDADKIIKEYK